MALTLNNLSHDAIPSGKTQRGAFTRYAAAVASVAVTYFVQLLLSPQLGQKFPFVFFVFAVIFSAYFGGRGPGLLSTVLSIIAVYFTFLLAPFSFTGAGSWEVVRIILFAAVGTVITLTVDRLNGAYENLRDSTSALEQANIRLQASQNQLLTANDQLRGSQDNLSEANARLKQSNDDLQKFAYSVSHDLQTPIRTISAFCQLLSLRYQGKLDKDADQILAHIDSGLGRMNDLVQDLLEYSKVTHSGAGAWTDTDCNQILSAVLKDCESSIRETNAVVTSGSLPTVRADPRRMSQVFMNLIENGLKYRSAHPPAIHVSAKLEDGRWVFSVTDNGIGFDMSHANTIFDVFVRLHGEASAYKGNGIGLALVKRIVERRGGTIWAESKPDSGSTFYFTVPSTPAGTDLS